MKYENKTTEEDEQNRILRIEMIAETQEENKLFAKGIGIKEPSYVECIIDLKKEKLDEISN